MRIFFHITIAMGYSGLKRDMQAKICFMRGAISTNVNWLPRNLALELWANFEGESYRNGPTKNMGTCAFFTRHPLSAIQISWTQPHNLTCFSVILNMDKVINEKINTFLEQLSIFSRTAYTKNSFILNQSQ